MRTKSILGEKGNKRVGEWVSVGDAHPVVAVPLLHQVGVEDPDDRAHLRLPVLLVFVPEQHQSHAHLQVMQVAERPGAERVSLGAKAGSERWH